jgi:histidinol-phosphatase
MLVAEGAVDAAVDAVGVAPWDLAAVQVIVEEAGGRFSDFEGARRIDGGTGVTSNGELHEELLAALAAQSRDGRPGSG